MTGRRGGGAWSSGRRRIGPASGSMERVGEDNGEGGGAGGRRTRSVRRRGGYGRHVAQGGRWGSFPRSDLDRGGGGRASGGGEWGEWSGGPARVPIGVGVKGRPAGPGGPAWPVSWAVWPSWPGGPLFFPFSFVLSFAFVFIFFSVLV